MISLKKIYKVRRTVNKYGAYGILLGNIIPFFSSEIISFALGLTKYNVTRLFLLTLTANIIKYSSIWIFYIIVH